MNVKIQDMHKKLSYFFIFKINSKINFTIAKVKTNIINDHFYQQL
jgi:hypothetical protein